MIIDGIFTSVWSNEGEVETKCKVNTETKEVFDIERRGIARGLKLLRSEVRHLGTEVNLQVLRSINHELKNHIDFMLLCK